MRWDLWFRTAFILMVVVVTTFIADAATKPDVVDTAYGGFSVSPPTPGIIFVCHGFGCRYRAEVDLTAGERAQLAQIMAAGWASPVAERKAVAAAGAWVVRRLAPHACTVNHVGRAGMEDLDAIPEADC